MNTKFTFTFLCGGALLFATGAYAQLTPGLKEARYNGQSVGGSWYPEPPSFQYTRTVPGPYAANAWGDEATRDTHYVVPGWWPPSGASMNGSVNGGWGNNMTFRYSGYIYIPQGSNTVAFGCSFDDYKRLVIDGKEVFRSTSWNTTGLGKATLATGWHSFDLWLDNGGSGFGPPAGANLWHPDRIGFGIDWTGAGSPVSNYVFPTNTAENIIFATTLPDDYVTLQSFPSPLAVGPTSASLPVTVSMGSGASPLLRLYYGATDGGLNPGAWDGYVDYPGAGDTPEAITTSGTYAVAVTGLDFNQTYYYRFAYFDAQGAHVFGHLAPTFITRVQMESQSATISSDGSVNLLARVPVPAGESGTYRVYYDTADKGASGEWSAHADLSGAFSSGTLAIPVSGLADATTYWFRHAFISENGSHTNFSSQSRSFLMANPNVPTSFAWTGTAATMDWSDPSGWINEASLARATPGIPGDRLNLIANLGFDRTYTLTNNVAFGSIRANSAVGRQFNIYPANDPVTITMSTGVAETPAAISLENHNTLRLGTPDTLKRDLMTIDLASPLSVNTSTTWDPHAVLFGGILTGGSSGVPALTISNPSNGDRYYATYVYLFNPNNDFKGDIIAGLPGNNPLSPVSGNGQFGVRICLGGRWRTDSTPVYACVDSLGHPDNRVILGNALCFLVLQDPPSTFQLNRTVMGIGQIRSVNMNGWGQEGNDQRRDLRLGPKAVVAPGRSDTSLGAIELFGTSLYMDPAATTRIKLTASGSDLCKFNFTNAINLSGKLELSQLGSAGHIRSGSVWTIAQGSSATSVLPATARFTSVSPDYRVYYNADATTGWKIIAVYTPPNIFMIR